MSQLFAWHRAAVSGEAPERYEGVPECGYYKRRMLKGGPWIPVRIYVDREIDGDTGELASDEVLRAEVNGVGGKCAVYQWTYLTPIARNEYETLLQDHQTSDLMAATHAVIDLSKTPILPRRKAHA
jgi:hypothetical protein